MKIFTKLYIGIMLILISSLLISGYLVVNTALNNSIKYELENDNVQHRLFANSLESNVVANTRSRIADEQIINELVRDIVRNTKTSVIVKMDDEEVFSNIKHNISYKEPVLNKIQYEIFSKDNKTFTVFTSAIEIRNIKYSCITVKEITKLIDDNNRQRKNYLMIYIIVILGATAFALIFSYHLTKPIKHLSEAGNAISNGAYGMKIPIISNDEIGDLTKNFNEMSEIVKEDMDALELSVKQKEYFIAAFAHETKTPMTSIIGYADLIYQGKLSEEDRKNAAETIMNEGMRLQALSEKLMDIVSEDEASIKKEEIAIDEMIEDLRKTLTPKAEAKKAVIDYHFKDGYIKVDYDLAKSVVINLVDNALKAGANLIDVSCEEKNEGADLIIKDNGIGISETDLNRVKEAFYMVDKSRSRKEHGAGLGLTLADKIMKTHGGSLVINSVLNEGTTVTLHFPNE
ncbi:MAG: HAMP domain-containing histidine kinase [Lachnospiraceae bacterium]|nr:HAMP domain-containing histidine kinase [Lachnospiraceae bacterium]